MTVPCWLRKTFWAGLILLAAVEAHGRVPGAPMTTYTLQSLANISPFYAYYLSIDESGGRGMLDRQSGEYHASTRWQIRSAGRERDYPASYIQNRGNSRYNGWYLDIDEYTGAPIMSRREVNRQEVPTAKWLIRYAGKFNGYDSYFIQNLASSAGGFDMSFLAMDETTGRVIITREPVPGAYWFKLRAPEFPTEKIR